MYIYNSVFSFWKYKYMYLMYMYLYVHVNKWGGRGYKFDIEAQEGENGGGS